MAKKEDLEKIEQLAEDLISDESVDRARLSDFIDRLLTADRDPAEIAEIVAKLFEASTRQSTARLNTLKALQKGSVDSEMDEDQADTFDEIGRPFEEDHGEN